MARYLAAVLLGAGLFTLCGGCGTPVSGADTAPAPAPPAGGAATPPAIDAPPSGGGGTAPAAAQPAAGDGFIPNAFPPVLPDIPEHAHERGLGWQETDCLRCHETGVGVAPSVRHRGLPVTLLRAKCRTCHVAVAGAKPRRRAPHGSDPGAGGGAFAANAFPPMIPASASHPTTWHKDDCLLCHEDGLRGAPIVRHAGLPVLLLKSKCRTCHVQVRAVDPRPLAGR